MKLWNRVRYFGRRRETERELEDELRAHRAMTEDRFLREGMTAEEARAAAARSFGNLTLALEDSRGAWNFAWLESLWQDVRYAFRCFRHAPLFSLTVILTIGIALGLNTVLFTGFNAYVLAPFSVEDPYSLYSFWWNTKGAGARGFSWEEFQQFRANNSVFSELVTLRRAEIRCDGQTWKGELVSGNFFSMLGITPALGRTLVPADAATPGSNPVIVLSYAFWKAKFQQNPSVIGRTVLLQGHPFEIVGVARHGFAGIRADPPDFWSPITMYSQLLNGPNLFGPAKPYPLDIVGRLKPNISMNQARASLLVTGKALTANYAPEDRVIGVRFQSNATSVPITRDTIEGALPGAVAFFLILLLACANVANMMLARAMGRQREIGLRLALGAARPRLIRQLLTEGFVLAMPSAGLGILVAWIGSIVGIRALYAVLPSEFASQVRVMPIGLDWRVFTFVLVAACVSTLAFALAPALQATRGDLVRATRGELTNRHRTGRLRNILVASQVAVCVMLLICSGILLRGSRHVQTIDLGLDVHNVIEIDTRQDLRARVSAILAADPSVESQAAAWQTPIYGSVRGIAVAPQGESSFVNAGFNYVSPEFFEVFRIPIIRGRTFTAEEARAAASVIIISGSTARRFWPNADAVGQTLRIRRPPQNGRRSDDRLPRFKTAEVIGIARDAISDSDIFEIDRSCLYFPANAAAAADYAILARVRGNSEFVRRSLDSSLATALPGAVTQMIPMEQILEVRYLPFRLFADISEALGGLALALTAIGIYGVIAYMATQRSKEIGIRIALGASSRSVIRLVVSQSIKLAVIGLGIGTVIALGVARLAKSEFFMLNTLEVPVYVVSITIVLAAAAVAAAVPARRASRLDPMAVLRHD